MILIKAQEALNKYFDTQTKIKRYQVILDKRKKTIAYNQLEILRINEKITAMEDECMVVQNLVQCGIVTQNVKHNVSLEPIQVGLFQNNNNSKVATSDQLNNKLNLPLINVTV
jgi:hypothetical protein